MRRLNTIFLLYVLPTIAIFTISTLASRMPMKDCVMVVLAGVPLGILIGVLATDEV